MDFIGIAVCVMWGTVAFLSVLSFVTVLQSRRRSLRRAHAKVLGKSEAPCPSGAWDVLAAKADRVVLFSIDGQTRSFSAAPGIYMDLQEGDEGVLSYRDGRVVGFEKAG